MGVTKKHEPEYTLHVFHGTNPETAEAVTAFAIRTTREFVSFMYEIPLEIGLKDSTIDLRVHGLRVPENLVSGKGHAHGVALLRKLKGDFSLNITNVDGAINRFSVKVLSREIVVKRLSKKPFVIYSTEKIRL
ncbi:MAG TPA: hypothetical protein VMM37_00640 [Bacteroidota bacterium]|nr:hypothetical protein [Bacteroidota bacterium]